MTDHSGAQADIEFAIHRHVTEHATRAADTLAALVKVPSDNPPGDCVPHALATAAELEKLGLAVERHPVPRRCAGRTA